MQLKFSFLELIIEQGEAMLRRLAHRLYRLSVPGYLLRTMIAVFRLPKFIDAAVGSIGRLTGFFEALNTRLIEVERSSSERLPSYAQKLERSLLTVEEVRVGLAALDVKVMAQAESILQTTSHIRQLKESVEKSQQEMEGARARYLEVTQKLEEEVGRFQHHFEIISSRGSLTGDNFSEAIQLLKHEVLLIKRDVGRGREILLKAIDNRRSKKLQAESIAMRVGDASEPVALYGALEKAVRNG